MGVEGAVLEGSLVCVADELDVEDLDLPDSVLPYDLFQPRPALESRNGERAVVDPRVDPPEGFDLGVEGHEVCLEPGRDDVDAEVGEEGEEVDLM